MCTYGRNDVSNCWEEIAYFQPHYEIYDIEKEILVLEQKKQRIIDSCTHHFVPSVNIMNSFKETLVPGILDVPDFGKVLDGELVTKSQFKLKCIRCHTTKKVDIAEHCPVCADKTIHRQTGSGPSGIGKYYKEYPYYVVPIEVHCTHCTFKAVVTLHERDLPTYKSKLCLEL